MSILWNTPARTAIMERRYAPAKAGWGDLKLTVSLWPRDVGGALQVLTGHASKHRSHSGILFNRRIRLVRRFDLSPFQRREV